MVQSRNSPAGTRSETPASWQTYTHICSRHKHSNSSLHHREWKNTRAIAWNLLPLNHDEESEQILQVKERGTREGVDGISITGISAGLIFSGTSGPSHGSSCCASHFLQDSGLSFRMRLTVCLFVSSYAFAPSCRTCQLLFWAALATHYPHPHTGAVSSHYVTRHFLCAMTRVQDRI